MEARKITIVSTKTQKKNVIMSEAETLGQLKVDLYNAGIDYDDMTFYEGTSKTELKLDDSILPKDVPYTNRTTGETKITNELVFMLTNTNKKIKSGMMSRREAFTAIKKHNLQSACIEEFGRNYTQCPTASLILLIEKNTKKAPKATKKTAVRKSSPNEVVDVQAREAIKNIAEVLLDRNDAEVVNKAISPINLTVKDDNCSPYSENELDDMFEDMYNQD